MVVHSRPDYNDFYCISKKRNNKILIAAVMLLLDPHNANAVFLDGRLMATTQLFRKYWGGKVTIAEKNNRTYTQMTKLIKKEQMTDVEVHNSQLSVVMSNVKDVRIAYFDLTGYCVSAIRQPVKFFGRNLRRLDAKDKPCDGIIAITLQRARKLTVKFYGDSIAHRAKYRSAKDESFTEMTQIAMVHKIMNTHFKYVERLHFRKYTRNNPRKEHNAEMLFFVFYVNARPMEEITNLVDILEYQNPK